jgi:hypothetical protein
MKKLYYIFLILIAFACNKEVINPIPPPVVDTKFVSKSPSYSLPNNSVGQIKNNVYFPGYYLTNDSLKVK